MNGNNLSAGFTKVHRLSSQNSIQCFMAGYLMVVVYKVREVQRTIARTASG
jgi:hypothetical protein